MIYALLCPDNHIVRYVGYSKDGVKRYKQHCRLSENKGNTKRQNWLRGLILNGKIPQLLVLQETHDDWCVAEKNWIKYYQHYSAEQLTNTAEGGTSNKHMQEAPKSNMTRKTRSKLSIALTDLKRSCNSGYYPIENYNRLMEKIRKVRKLGRYHIMEQLYEEENNARTKGK